MPTAGIRRGKWHSPAGLAVAQEVRAHVRGLPRDQRTTFLMRAIDAHDRRTAAAVFAAPPFLSGLDDKVVEQLREHAAHRWAGADHAQLRAVEAVQGRIRACDGATLDRYTRATKWKGSPRSRARRKVAALKSG